MVKKNNLNIRVSGREIIMTRVFDAPRELVFKIMADPNALPQWWGPRILTTVVDKMDVRQGGVWRYVQRDLDGNEYVFNGVYREIVPPERVVSTFEFEGMPGHVVINTIIFEEHDGKTKITVTSLFQTVEDRDEMLQSGMESGAAESYDRLDEYLANMSTEKEIVITRIFDAPRELVWKAWTNPEHMKRWMGPKDFTTPFCKIDFHVGGVYLFCMRSPEGKDYWSTGVYREIIPLEKIMMTDSFADEKGNVVPATHYGMSDDCPLEMLVTVTFEEHDGKTKMILRHVGIPAGIMSDMTNVSWNVLFDKLAESLK